MKRIFRFGIVLLLLVCAVAALSVISSAYYTGEYGDTPLVAVNDGSSDLDTPLVPLNAVWQVTHDNGYKEYASTFLGGFELVREGSVMKLLPSYLNVNIASTYTVPTNTKYTIDFGDSTIVLTNKDIRTAALLFKGVNDVTILADGARVFLQEATSSFMTFSGNSRLTVYGGEGKLSVWAPDALELGDNAHAELHDVYFYKNHGNMRALLGVRGNSSAALYDSLLFTEQNRVAILMHTGGKVTLTDTSIISADSTGILDFDGDNISFATYGACYFYGKLVGTPRNVTLSGDVYTNFGIKDEYLAQGHAASAASKTKSFETSKFSAPNQSVDAPMTASFAYRVMSLGKLTDSEEEGSIWRIDNADGETVGYTDNFHYPFRNYKLTAGTRLTLLCDVTEPTPGFTASLDGDLTVDLGDNVIQVGDGGFGVSDSLFSFEGEGRVNIFAENARIIFDSEGALLRLGGYVSSSISFGGSYHLISCLATAVRGDLTVLGGTVSTSGDFLVSDYGNITLDGVCVMTDAVQLFSVGGDVILRSTELITDGGSISCGRLLADASSLVCGEIEATSVSAEAGARFSHTLGSRTDFFLREDSFDLEASRPKIVDGELVLGEASSCRFDYVAVSTEGNVMANMTLAGSATLNVYIPVYVKNGTESVAVRIVHDGLVYSEGTVKNKIIIDGTEYFVYSYPYIYQNTLLEKTRIDLLCDGILVRIEVSPKELLLSSLEGCRDEGVLRGTVAYLSYALLASDDPDITSALLPYAEYLPDGRAKYTPTSDSECLRTVYFNAEESTLDFYLRDGTEVKELRFSYGGKDISALPDDDGIIRVPMYRLDNREAVRILIKDGESNRLVSLDIIELYALVSASPSRSAELFGRYLAYLLAI